MKSRARGLYAIALTAPACAFAQQLSPAPEVRTDIVVTATRVPQEGANIPAAIDFIDARAIREDKPQVNLSEAINRVPGIVVQNRQNYAQDLQISSRGFGGRSTFGVRGVRLIADGIPATMPDGQGQAATFSLSSAERIEVLRGPFSTLYGNASGGVVQIFTADGPPVPTGSVSYYGGSYGTWKAGAQFGGTSGSLNYIADISRFETDGYRDHSAATRDHLNAKFKADIGIGRLTFIVNALDQPDTQDPLGLTRAQWQANPRQVDSSAIQFNTRKSIRQAQGGAVYDAQAAGLGWHAKAYAGDRQVTQFLGQGGDGPLMSGGVVDLDRAYGGAGVRVSKTVGSSESPLTLTAGWDGDRMKERRRGFVNTLGNAGALRRDEDDLVSNTDFFAQGEWSFRPQWVLSGGARHSRVRFESRDFYVVGTNPDDSGTLTFSRTTPVAGLLFKPSASWSLYANAGEGFETPTFAELAYRPGGATGLNFALKPARSRHAEVGAKARWLPGMRFAIALFRIDTRDEIVVNTASAGRTDFKNASRTRRNGAEASLDARFGGFEVSIAYTHLDARFTESFTSGSPPVTVAARSQLPGVPRSVLHAEATWRHASSGFRAGAELHSAAKIFVNEANSDAAPAYTVANLRAGFEQRFGRWQLSEFVRVDNVADRRYAGSVIVSEARSRFFEPAPGRTASAGLQVSSTF
jgi:iron complex outermembrane recepter protein